ncbi:two-component system OmpR family sensor kinase [Knoellia remsis]|uniref:histidine kinase n=1 Tax=Knoellia remsis TaxID=407159 RepID=A0A2T0TX42_9MICO|nr:HAMP domain-containing sensor histidine kinase [Knoellia remsis]PRY50272.1 two-component system OmpR family sensor kinase [Knoellia remsis]
MTTGGTRLAFLRPRSWPLTTQLIAAVVALFLVLSVGTATFTVLALRGQLLDQIDADVTATLARATGEGAGRPGGPGDGPAGGPGVGPVPGGRGESVTVILDDEGSFLVNRIEHGMTVGQLSSDQLDALDEAHLGSRPRTVDIAGVGDYRVAQATTPTGLTVISGLPMSGVTQVVNTALTLVAGATIVGLALATLVGQWLIRRGLAPLQRVAQTATQVSRLRLDSGDVALAQRVPEADTDARTEAGQVGLALNQMLDNVEGALRSRHESETRVRQFVADASHELRTPLASIRGYAELSRRETAPVPETVAHALTRVESESLRMQGLVEDLLLLARLDAGRPLEREPVDLSLLAVNAVSDAHAASPEHRWELDLPDEPVEVPGDPARLHQVVANLLANARTHTPPGTRVVTSLRREGAWVRLSVTDNGPGVPAELLGSVFERFTRGDAARNRAGGSTGLGLSIVDAVARTHGGRVEVDSAPGRATFSVVLPA